jgi:hypothetical protein
MRNFLWSIALGVFVFTACEQGGEGFDIPTSESKAGGKPVAGNYGISSSWDGHTLTFTVDQSATQAVSHILLQVTDCDGNFVDHVVSSSIPVTYTTGNGTGCWFDNGGSFIKFDDLDIYQKQGSFTISVTFSEGVKLESAQILIKSAKNCFPFDLNITPNCGGGEVDGHETAYAFGGDAASCFINYGFNRWGWTNQISEGAYEWPIYAGAGQCDLSKGTHVGTLSVQYADGTVTATYNLFDGFALNTTAHFYAGSTAVPQRCNPKSCTGTVAPGEYSVQGQGNTYSVSGLSGNIYVIAHAEVGTVN